MIVEASVNGAGPVLFTADTLALVITFGLAAGVTELDVTVTDVVR